MALNQTDRISTPIQTMPAARGRDRLTLVGGWSLLAICVLHTVAFIVQPWWGLWLAGPFRTEEAPLEAVAQFWALPGSFVVAGALLAVSIISTGRRGGTSPLYVPITLGLWSALCVWIMGPSGFMLLVVPVALLIIAAVRARRAATRSGASRRTR